MSDPDHPNPEAQIRQFIAERLAGGFLSPEEIAEAALEYDEEIDTAVSGPIVERLLPDLIREKLAAQATWPVVTDCDKLDAALNELTKAGIVCRQNFTCCQNCGFAEIGAEIEDEAARGIKPRGLAFYHQQDTDGAAEGDGRHGLHLSFAAIAGDADHEPAALRIAHEIVATLASHGLTCDWDGTLGRRIAVNLNWQRRLFLPVP